jgi:hypothetical protein
MMQSGTTSSAISVNPGSVRPLVADRHGPLTLLADDRRSEANYCVPLLGSILAAGCRIWYQGGM